MLALAESLVNARPLTRTAESAVLTPDHSSASKNSPSCLWVPESVRKKVKSDHLWEWFAVKSQIEAFLARMRPEYHKQLCKCLKWYKGHRTRLKPNDVVLVLNKTKPRLSWQRAAVLDNEAQCSQHDSDCKNCLSQP